MIQLYFLFLVYNAVRSNRKESLVEDSFGIKFWCQSLLIVRLVKIFHFHNIDLLI